MEHVSRQTIYILDHRTKVNKFKIFKSESVFFDHNEIKAGINNRKITGKSMNAKKFRSLLVNP